MHIRRRALQLRPIREAALKTMTQELSCSKLTAGERKDSYVTKIAKIPHPFTELVDEASFRVSVLRRSRRRHSPDHALSIAKDGGGVFPGHE